MANVRRKLQRAFADSPEVTQTQIADVIGVNRSVINRQLRGNADISLSRVAEMACLMGFEVEFDLVKPAVDAHANYPQNVNQFVGKAAVTAGRTAVPSPSRLVHFE